jgi:hypothetical protein
VNEFALVTVGGVVSVIAGYLWVVRIFRAEHPGIGIPGFMMPPACGGLGRKCGVAWSWSSRDWHPGLYDAARLWRARKGNVGGVVVVIPGLVSRAL